MRDADASSSQKSQGGDGSDAKSRHTTKTAQSEEEPPHDKVERKYPDFEDNRPNVDDNEDPTIKHFAVPGGNYIIEGENVSCFHSSYVFICYCFMHFHGWLNFKSSHFQLEIFLFVERSAPFGHGIECHEYNL